jgi:hypothetical protein
MIRTPTSPPRTPKKSKYQVGKPSPLRASFAAEQIAGETVAKPKLTDKQHHEQQLESIAEKSVTIPSSPRRRWRMGRTVVQPPETNISTDVVDSAAETENFADDPTCIVVRMPNGTLAPESDSDSGLSDLTELSKDDDAGDSTVPMDVEEDSVADTAQQGSASQDATFEPTSMGTGPRGIKRLADDMVSGRQRKLRRGTRY